MSTWVIWLVAACVLGIGEMLTMGLFMAPLAVGALAAAMASLAGLGGLAAVAAFIVASALAFGLLRPVALRHRRLPPTIRTGAAALVGRPAIVLERIANREGVGAVKIDGEVWTARAYEDDLVIDAGEHVQVVQIKGATALVME